MSQYEGSFFSTSSPALIFHDFDYTHPSGFIFLYNPHYNPGYFIIPIWQMRKLRYREVT